MYAMAKVSHERGLNVKKYHFEHFLLEFFQQRAYIENQYKKKDFKLFYFTHLMPKNNWDFGQQIWLTNSKIPNS